MSAKAIREYDGKRLLSRHLKDPSGKLVTSAICAQVRPSAPGPA